MQVVPAPGSKAALYAEAIPEAKFAKGKWFGRELPEELMNKIISHPECVWHDQKLVLLHQSCPDSITEEFLSDPLWYKRLTAGLSKHKRAKYLKRLYTDAKSTVRAAAYKTAIAEQLDDINAVAKRIVADKWVHGYFYSNWDMKWMRMLADGMTDAEVTVLRVEDYELRKEADRQWHEDYAADVKRRFEGISNV